MQPLYIATKGSALNADEYDSNLRASLDRSNHTGQQLAETISDLVTTVSSMSVITSLETDIATLQTLFNQLQNDVFGSGSLQVTLDNLQATLEEDIQAVDEHVNTVEQQTATLGARVTSVESNLEAINNVLEGNAPPPVTGTPGNEEDFTKEIQEINQQLALKAPLNNAALAGNPTVPTPTVSDNSERIANCEYVNLRLATFSNSPSSDSAIPPGTRMLFQQSTAPIGWTKDITHNNKALRIVSGSVGTGGTKGFTTVFNTPFASDTTAPNTNSVSQTTGSTVITNATMPSHQHAIEVTRTNVASGSGTSVISDINGATVLNTEYTGGDEAHTHTIPAHSHSVVAHAHNMNFSLAYVDVIIATKN